MQKQQFEIHPAATLFPLMTEEEYAGLKQDIAENGQREPIVTWKNQLIDGRNRLRACEELQREPTVAELDEEHDPWKYVLSHNLHRRHLTTSQRSAIAAKMATLKRGSNQYKKEDGQNCLPTEDAASLLNVSERSVKSAKRVLEHGSAELVKAVECGEIPVSVASQLAVAEPSKETQTALVKQGREAIKEHVAEKTPKAKADTTKQKEVARCSSAMEFATMAISQLERIQPDDEKRFAAFAKVKSWMDKQERKMQ